MRHLLRTLTLMLACLMLLETALPCFAAEQEEAEAEIAASETVEVEPEETEQPTQPEEPEEPTQPEEPEQPEEEPEEAVAVPDEIPEEEPVEETAGQAPQSVQQPLSEPEEPSEEATEEQLYNGMEADYDDPQFLKLLAEGFFDEDEGPVRALASYQHASVFKGYKITKGVDVSKWNNRTDWVKAKKNGIDFALIRCGNRFVGDGHLGTDEMFATNMKGALNAGLEVGVYIYSQAISVKEAIEEANYALKLCKGYTFTLPIVMDYEYYAPNQGRLAKANLSRDQRTRICLAFCNTIRNAGYPAMVYANRNMLSEDMYGQRLADAGYEVWLAEWNSTPKYTGTYTYWQYSDNGRIGGFDHQVDVNFRYQLPDAPVTSLTYAEQGVQVVWTKVAPAKGYRLYRKQAGEDWVLLTEVSGNTTVKYLDTTAVLNNRYAYSVQAVDGQITGVFDSVGKTFRYQKEVRLKELKKTSAGQRIEWVRDSAYDQYQIFRRQSETDPWTPIDTVEGTVSSYVDTTPMPSGATWFYSVAGAKEGRRDGYNEYGLSLFYLSNPVLTGTTAQTAGIQVQWKKTAGAEKYYVYRKTGSEKWSRLGTTQTLTFTDQKASSGVSYVYTVRAYGNGTLSGYDSKGVSGYWLITPQMSSVCSMKGGKQVEVVWKKVSGAEQYRVFRKLKSGGKWTALAYVTGTSYIDTGVTKGANYYYTVRAYSKKPGKQVSSGYESGMAAVWLDIPVLTGAKQVTKGVQVSWKKVSGAKQYILYRKKEGGSWSKVATVKNVTSYVDTAPIAGVKSLYTLRAVSGKTTSSYDRNGVSVLFLAAPKLNTPVQKKDVVSLSWKASAGVQSYRVYRKKAADSSWTFLGDTTATSYLDTTAAKGKWVYTVKGRAKVEGVWLNGLYDTKGVTITVK